MDSGWLNGNDFQWLKPTQPDHTFSQGFQIGASIKQHMLDYDLRQQQMAMQWRLMETNNELRKAKLHADEVRTQGMAELSGVLGRIAEGGDWTDPKLRAQFWDTAGRYPQLMTDPSFKELTQQFELADAAKLRKQIAEDQITGRQDLEDIKFQNRQQLLHEKYAELAGLQSDSQEARLKRDEINHLNRMEENEKKPHSGGGVPRFNLPWTDQAAMKAELDGINKDPFSTLKPEERSSRIEAVYRKWKAVADEYERKRGQPKASATVPELDFDAATGTFKERK